jgi:hypothetical protein
LTVLQVISGSKGAVELGWIGPDKDDWVPFPKEQPKDQFGGVRVPQPKAK